MREEPMNRDRTMRYSHRVAGLKPATVIGAAGLVAGVLLAGGISTVPAPGPHAPGDAAASQPLAPGVASARLTSVDVSAQQPPPADPKAVVVTGGDPGNGNGPRAIVIGDPGGDGPGPKAVVIPGGGPPP